MKLCRRRTWGNEAGALKKNEAEYWKYQEKNTFWHFWSPSIQLQVEKKTGDFATD